VLRRKGVRIVLAEEIIVNREVVPKALVSKILDIPLQTQGVIETRLLID
jgi:hypothetical protein